MSHENIIHDMLAQPEKALQQIEKLNCEESLLEFVKAAWHTKHPASEPFIVGTVTRRICAHLEAVTRGEIDKLLINVPPGCTKSYLVNVMWPLWEWGPKKRPHEKYISAGYNLDLPVRDLGYARDIMRSEWFQQHWPMENKKDSDGKENYTNTSGGWRKATGITGGLTGWRGSRFIIDDPLSTGNAESDVERATCRKWFGETVPSRFTNPDKPVYVIIMQRLHTTDLSGMIIEDLVEKQGWVHLCLPMEFESQFASYSPVPVPGQIPEKVRRVKDEGEPLPYYVEDLHKGEFLYRQDWRTTEMELLWPERFTVSAVDDLKASFQSAGGSYAEACQLQQRPIPRAGGMFDASKLQYVDTIPTDAIYCRGWDLAATKDGSGAWSVGLLMAISQGRIYIVDVLRGRWGAGEVMDKITSSAAMDGYSCQQDFPQDPGQAGKSQKAYIAKQLMGFDFVFSTESGSKEDRARPLASQLDAENVYVLNAHWTPTFVAELGLFPGGKWKDQIDAASRAFANLCKDQGPGEIMAPRLIS